MCGRCSPPETEPAAGAYFWPGNKLASWSAAALVGGQIVASDHFQRRLTNLYVDEQTVSPSSAGFAGALFTPREDGRHPAILLIGGSNGGMSSVLEAAWLAGHGFPALSIAYFNYPGLPRTLSRIPLEYFARALRWLARQRHVDPTRLIASGVSRGSEAAQLLGVHYPNLVHAVIALVPSDATICSYPSCGGPAWTRNGRPVPFTRDFDDPHPVDNPAAVIPVERIPGPVFLDCGTADQVWASCPYSRAIIDRLDAHNDHYTHVRYAYTGAGHAIGSFVPYEASLARSDNQFVADQQDRAALAQRLLAFLDKL